MRLSDREKDIIIRSALHAFGLRTKVVLFGSRTNDAALGGDIDLLIIPPDGLDKTEYFNRKIKLIIRILESIGEQKIDVIVRYPDDNRGIIQTALNEGIQLC